MKFSLIGDLAEILPGAEILEKRLGYTLDPSGMPLRVTKRPGPLTVSIRGGEASIAYAEKIHFFRGLGLLCQHAGEEFSVTEEPKLEKNGIMYDASRNSVMKVEAIKDFLEIMAIMGLNLIMMYTEDTYTVPEYPYFGYMRGRYSYEELHECDEYAALFGIEMMACVEALGHMAKALKWSEFANVRDTEMIFNVGEEETYAVLRNLLRAATAPYRSKRVHVGLDEAFAMGLGKYLNKHPHTSHAVLMPQHVKRVKEICDELGLEMMMWSDMFFRAASGGRYHYPQVQFTEEFKASIPQDVGLVYWDYYNTDEDFYTAMMEKHLELSPYTIFAGGIWIWGCMTVNYKAVFNKTVPALRACMKAGVKEVIATMWGDCGAQTNVYEALLGMQLYAEMGYGYDGSYDHIKARFLACTGENADAFLELTLLDDLGQADFGQQIYGDANPSEYLLWQNILMGMMDAHIDIPNISQLYAQRKALYAQRAAENTHYPDIFLYSYHLASVLELKADLGVRIKNAYDSGDKAALEDICTQVLPELKDRVEQFKAVYRRLWYSAYKGFGFDILDTRLGGVLAGIDTAAFRIRQYLSGEVSHIEELEEVRLPYKAIGYEYKDGLSLHSRCYTSYASGGYYSLGNTDL